MLNFCFDLDNVLAQTNETLIDRWAWQYDPFIEWTVEDMRSHLIEESFPGHVPEGFCDAAFADEQFWREIAAHEEMIAAMRAACRATLGPKGSGRVHVATARFVSQHPEIERITREWLESHGFFQVHLGLMGAAEKIGYARRHAIQVFVEDRFDTAQALARAGVPTFLVALPYNRPTIINEAPHPRVRRLPRAEVALAITALAQGEPIERFFAHPTPAPGTAPSSDLSTRQ